jgi:hypothetical protein
MRRRALAAQLGSGEHPVGGRDEAQDTGGDNHNLTERDQQLSDQPRRWRPQSLEKCVMCLCLAIRNPGRAFVCASYSEVGLWPKNKYRAGIQKGAIKRDAASRTAGKWDKQENGQHAQLGNQRPQVEDYCRA